MEKEISKVKYNYLLNIRSFIVCFFDTSDKEQRQKFRRPAPDKDDLRSPRSYNKTIPKKDKKLRS